MKEGNSHSSRLLIIQENMSLRGILYMLPLEQRLESSFINLPDLTVKSFIIIIVKLLVLHHPVPKLLIL